MVQLIKANVLTLMVDCRLILVRCIGCFISLLCGGSFHRNLISGVFSLFLWSLIC